VEETATPEPTAAPMQETPTESSPAADEAMPTPTAQPIIQQTEPSPLFTTLRLLLTLVCISSIVAVMVVLLIHQSKKGQGR
jgi:hypothetical protein